MKPGHARIGRRVPVAAAVAVAGVMAADATGDVAASTDKIILP
jgi:hypothetical protein